MSEVNKNADIALVRIESDKVSAIDYICGRWWGLSVESILHRLSLPTIIKVTQDLEKNLKIETTESIRNASTLFHEDKRKQREEIDK